MTPPRHFPAAAMLASMMTIVLLQPATALSQKPPIPIQNAPLSTVDAALSAGKLRASSQRVARLYLESGRGLRVQRTRIALASEIAIVDASLAALRKISLRGEKEKRDLQRALDAVSAQWAELRTVLTTPYAPDRAQMVYDISEQMYIYSSKTTFLFEDLNNSEAGYMTDVAGRLQSNSERISKAAIHGIISRNASSAVDFIAWKKEYIEAYRELVGSPLNDDFQKRNLELGNILWGFFDDVITRAAERSDISQILAISKCADGMWDIAQSSRITYVAALKKSNAKDKFIARNSSKAL